MSKNLIGRKLVVKWATKNNPDMVVEVTKKVRHTEKERAYHQMYNTDVVLCNVYLDENGNEVVEPLGKPEGLYNGYIEGYDVNTYLSYDNFWRMPNETFGK